MTTDVCDRPVLIVDDDQDVAESLVETLSDFGYVTRCAANGAEALAELRSGEKPCVILLDMMMPVMDGQQFRNIQREDPELREIPVIVLTANVAIGPVVEQMRVMRLLPKPVNLTDLLSAIADACLPRAG